MYNSQLSLSTWPMSSYIYKVARLEKADSLQQTRLNELKESEQRHIEETRRYVLVESRA